MTEPSWEQAFEYYSKPNLLESLSDTVNLTQINDWFRVLYDDNRLNISPEIVLKYFKFQGKENLTKRDFQLFIEQLATAVDRDLEEILAKLCLDNQPNTESENNEFVIDECPKIDPINDYNKNAKESNLENNLNLKEEEVASDPKYRYSAQAADNFDFGNSHNYPNKPELELETKNINNYLNRTGLTSEIQDLNESTNNTHLELRDSGLDLTGLGLEYIATNNNLFKIQSETQTINNELPSNISAKNSISEYQSESKNPIQDNIILESEHNLEQAGNSWTNLNISLKNNLYQSNIPGLYSGIPSSEQSEKIYKPTTPIQLLTSLVEQPHVSLGQEINEIIELRNNSLQDTLDEKPTSNLEVVRSESKFEAIPEVDSELNLPSVPIFNFGLSNQETKPESTNNTDPTEIINTKVSETRAENSTASINNRRISLKSEVIVSESYSVPDCEVQSEINLITSPKPNFKSIAAELILDQIPEFDVLSSDQSDLISKPIAEPSVDINKLKMPETLLQESEKLQSEALLGTLKSDYPDPKQSGTLIDNSHQNQSGASIQEIESYSACDMRYLPEVQAKNNEKQPQFQEITRKQSSHRLDVSSESSVSEGIQSTSKGEKKIEIHEEEQIIKESNFEKINESFENTNETSLDEKPCYSINAGAKSANVQPSHSDNETDQLPSDDGEESMAEEYDDYESLLEKFTRDPQNQEVKQRLRVMTTTKNAVPKTPPIPINKPRPQPIDEDEDGKKRTGFASNFMYSIRTKFNKLVSKPLHKDNKSRS